MQRADVAQEGQKLAAAFARLDVSVELVGLQVVGGEQVTDAVRARERRASPAPAHVAAAASAGPLAAGVWLRFSGPNSSIQMTLSGSPGPGSALLVGDRVDLEHPVLLGLKVRVVGLLAGLQALKGTPSARNSVRRPSWLMSSTTPLSTKKSASLDRLHVENGRS